MINVCEFKVGRNQFKCFHCRLIFAQRDGDWFNWDQIQVHLCKKCDKLTQEDVPRSYKES